MVKCELMIRIAEIDVDNPYMFMSEIEPILAKLADYGNVEAGLAVKRE